MSVNTDIGLFYILFSIVCDYLAFTLTGNRRYTIYTKKQTTTLE